MAVPFRVKALYEYTSSHEDDLPFTVGQIITVTDEEDDDWYGGEYVDDSGVKQEGIFPRNFVEKFEPAAPPRPTRPRKKESDPAPAPTSPPAPRKSFDVASGRASEETQQEPAIASPPTSPAAVTRSPPAPPAIPVSQPPQPAPVAAPAPPPPVPASAPAPAPAQPVPKEPARGKSPPPVAEKPSTFKDRIAAFNKPAAPPIAPFKPGGLSSGGTGFIKKPFVAPPPSRNAYVPPPQNAPTAKVYRREEDPEIKERQAENQESAERAGLAPTAAPEGESEDQPRPTSLKERIALLQRQQAEQAQRHAEAAAKKAKPKRPPPKRNESDSAPAQTATALDDAEAHAPPLERKDSAEISAAKKSVDINRNSMDDSSPPPRQPLPIRRKSKGPVENDGNEADMSGAGDTTEGVEDLTEKEDSDSQLKPAAPIAAAATSKPAAENTEAGEEGGEEEEEEEDPEVRRREELRARMAKMSGGMGFHGMFGPPGMPMGGAAPPKKKAPPPPPPGERRSSEATDAPSSPRGAPPIPTMMALPGLGKQRQQAETEAVEAEKGETTENTSIPVATATSPRTEVPEPTSPGLGGAPPIPGSRPAPPPVPTQSRPPPPPPPGAAAPTTGSESDDELSENPQKSSLVESSPVSRAPPPIPIASPSLPPSSPRASVDREAPYYGEEGSLSSPPMSPQLNKRHSRPPPPVPGAAPPSTQGRPPPPPPPGGVSRSSTADWKAPPPMKPGTLDNGEEGENTEYEGDYDTDIASSVHHKDALKAHARESSLEDNTPTSEVPPTMPPPPPTAAAPRAGPPLPPNQPPPNPRTSVDASRPPPPPPAKEATQATPLYTDDDYDPFNYNATQGIAVAQPFGASMSEEPQPAPEATPGYQAPPPPRGPPSAPPGPPRPPPKKSLDLQRAVGGRRSMDGPRSSMSMESGFMANEIDLATHTNWWLAPNGLPPVFQGRRDIYVESKESTTSGPDGRALATKEVNILFQDYSQTMITILSDPQNPSSTEVDQRHEPPPRSLRQDQLEEAYEKYGRTIASTVATKKDAIVGDGSPHGLVYELLKPFQDALRPVGTRAYGALVYANLANAATQMNDEIRPGDIVSFRNAKFSGKHGPMHAKYSTEVGKPDHVGVVAEWDGTKKKVRAWEQGRESKKCKLESFKLDDLRSGEVKIWRVMPRSWVGWGPDSQD